MSDTEPELGLGIILKTEFGKVELLFPASNEHRHYALESAPLRRVVFKAGDHIQTHDGVDYVVEKVEVRDGLLVYLSGGKEIEEAELDDAISFSKPEDRLLTGHTDSQRLFELRAEALRRRAEMRKSPVRGFVGGRVDLIPHQLSIAAEVSSRLRPRVLLADEVGLGKTIEACLILHRLHLTGRAERVLVVLPEPLMHQWFVELLRRFNLLFSLFDEERCASIEANDPEANPFLDSQLVLCSVDFLAGDARRADQVVEAGWDLLVVDEAHHLEWSREGGSASYVLVERLAGKTEGVLLLTATPQQLGREGHFARLRLLDPDRYEDLDRFIEEADHYEEVADAIGRLQEGELPSDADVELFGKKSGGVMRHVEALRGGDEDAREQLVGELVDEFGTGRVMFRHTRAALSGFPERKASLVPLEGDDEEAVKIDWLVELLTELDEEKVLLICKTREMAESLSERLRALVEIPCALFHEGLTLLQRDRNAAYFAEEEEGARILFCSEIGSEGRNFQFAHHLVLYDLPENPELLEQRIGRLDRIGQTATIQIHVPFLKGSRGEVLARWYQEGLGAFEKSLHGAAEISRGLRDDLDAVVGDGLEAFLEKSRVLTAEVAGRLERGYDRLLELNSMRAPKSEELIEMIESADEEAKFETFIVKVMDHYGVNLEELGDRSYYLRPGDLTTDAFPAIPDEGLSVTFDRERALGREDIGFMTKDHPIVRGAMDLLLGSEAGNSAFGVWEGSGEDALLLEVYGVLECVAPASLHADRFLPATPIRVVVDHQLVDRTGTVHLAKAKLRRGDLGKVLEKPAIKQQFLPAMLKKGQELVEMVGKKVSTKAAGVAESQLDSEIERLNDLQAINDHIKPDEIEGLEKQKAALTEAVTSARVRLDAVRIVLRKR